MNIKSPAALPFTYNREVKMKYVVISIIAVFAFLTALLGFGQLRNQEIYMKQYKQALDAGTDAASKHVTYASGQDLDGLSYGFGEGMEHANHIPVDKEEALEWFYLVLYRSLKLENEEMQQKLKKYIPMKCVVSFSNIAIADKNDNWVIDKDFVIEYGGTRYLFTLSNQVQNVETGVWYNEEELGLDKESRQLLVSQFIKTTIDDFLNNRENKESEITYSFQFGLNDMDTKLKSVNGSNFIVLCEGLPLPSLSLFEPEKKYFAFSLGGSEIVRE